MTSLTLTKYSALNNVITFIFTLPQPVKSYGFGYFESIMSKKSAGVNTSIVLALKSFLLRVTMQSVCSSIAERYYVASS